MYKFMAPTASLEELVRMIKEGRQIDAQRLRVELSMLMYRLLLFGMVSSKNVDGAACIDRLAFTRALWVLLTLARSKNAIVEGMDLRSLLPPTSNPNFREDNPFGIYITANGPPLIDEAEAAQILKISRKTLANRRDLHQPPLFIKVGNSVWYTRADIERIAAEERKAYRKGGTA